jgi:hypothetical protein
MEQLMVVGDRRVGALVELLHIDVALEVKKKRWILLS